jgi:hypothetical protein
VIGTLFHYVMERCGLDFRAFLAQRPALINVEEAFGASVAADPHSGLPPAVEAFLGRAALAAELGPVAGRLLDRLQANTDPLQKAEALSRVLEQLKNEIEVKAGTKIPPAAVDQVLCCALAKLNPPRLFITFVFMYEFLFARIDLFVESGELQHPLKDLQALLEGFYAVQADAPKVELIRFVRTKPIEWRIAIIGESGQSEEHYSWKTIISSWTGITQRLLKAEEYVIELDHRQRKIERLRLIVKHFDDGKNALTMNPHKVVILNSAPGEERIPPEKRYQITSAEMAGRRGFGASPLDVIEGDKLKPNQS